MTLKEKFIEKTISDNGSSVKNFDVLVTLVKLPTGAVEVITNHGDENIQEKIQYLVGAYDEDFKLKANPKVEIVDFVVY